MGRYNLSPKAKQDLQSIRRYIAHDSVRHADRVMKEIRKKMRELADNPNHGHRREDLTKRPLLFWPIFSYLIVYRVETSPLEIVAVPSSFENVEAILRKDTN